MCTYVVVLGVLLILFQSCVVYLCSCVGALLSLFPQYCYVLEMDGVIVGFVAMAMNAWEYQQQRVEKWLPEMKNKYMRGTDKMYEEEMIQV